MASLMNSMGKFVAWFAVVGAPMVALPSQPVNAQQANQDLEYDWPTFLGPRRDNRSNEKGLNLSELRKGIPLLWQVDCGAGYAACSVADGRCYLFDGADGQARLRCLNAGTGEQLWVYEYVSQYEDMYGYDAGPRCAPVVDEGSVYVYGVEGELHSIDAVTGKRRWAIDVMNEFGCIQNFFGVGSTPAAYGDLLLVMVGGSPPDATEVPPGRLDLVESNGSAVVAFEKESGKVVYETGADLASYASIVVRRVRNRDWAFAFARGGLMGFDPGNGNIAFSFPWRASKLESVNASTPVVVSNRVFVSESYGPGCALVEFSESGDTKEIWKDTSRRDQILACHWCTPVFHDGHLFGCHGESRSSAELRCVAWSDGEVRWSESGLGRSSLVYADGHLLCLTEGGELLLIAAQPARFEVACQLKFKQATGKIVPAPELLEYPAWAAPVVARGRLYLRAKGTLICAQLMANGSG